MKKSLYLLLFGFISLTACNKDILNKKPLNIIIDENVYSDAALIDAFLTQMYAQTAVMVNESPAYTNGFDGDWQNSEQFSGPFFINQLADEAKQGWQIPDGNTVSAKAGGLTINGGVMEWWEMSYKTIRSLNEFIQRVPTSPINDTAIIKKRVAEAKFLRAFNYFAMVKRYGGVPLITKVQNVDDPKEILYPARNSEQEVYDFVISEMNAISGDLIENNTPADFGRPTKYAALALKCRAALYAGSIAQFGTMQLNGVLGIPVASAPNYYQQSYDAAKTIITSNEFALYNADPDKTKNFRNIFNVKRNSEVIFAKQHNYNNAMEGGNAWNYDFFQCPKPHAWDAGNANAVYLEMVEEFENKDGTPGTLDRAAIQQRLWTTDEMWGNKDPRLLATVYTMNTPWKGSIVDPHNGLILPDGTILTSEAYNGVLAKGTQKIGEDFLTGFGVMKMLDETANNLIWISYSGSDYVVFRYGEVLLNLAEAAFELGKQEEALNAINQIRTRAGIAPVTAVNREKIRHERKVELAFEGHRYWDLRRWRIAESVLSLNRSGLRYIQDYTTGKFKLQVLDNIDGTVAPPKFFSYNYYLPITLVRTGNNPNLVENPGYH